MNFQTSTGDLDTTDQTQWPVCRYHRTTTDANRPTLLRLKSWFHPWDDKPYIHSGSRAWSWSHEQFFLPRDAMLSAVYAVVVCLCVCLSVTLRFRVIASYLSKVANFYPPHLHLSPPGACSKRWQTKMAKVKRRHQNGDNPKRRQYKGNITKTATKNKGQPNASRKVANY